ncbi:MAG: electron transfer flavoprotein subunit alpha/FixB family protein [Proteobacteria bacterium]|nr:electron transfer flavoprotein subunit alpha/FixB family protein [Pseudomonadota bacterium]
MKHGNVAVFIQQHNGKIENVSLELLGKALDIAHELKTNVSAYLPCEKAGDMPKILFSYGADNVYIIENAELKEIISIPYAKAVVEAVKKDAPGIVLFGATRAGRDIAPRVASSMKSGLTADCTELKIGPYTDNKTGKTYEQLLYQIRPAFGGNIIATIINPVRHPQMATVREGVMKMKTPDNSRKGQIIPLTITLSPVDLSVKIINKIVKEKKVNLTGANIIVSGGMGVGSKENFDRIRELADIIGGEIGASRAAVDQGWVSKEHQVGQTGVTVRPKLYIACGISGSIQHKAGMDQSLKIIAINNNPEAPIFNFAHIKIVGDLNTVIPMMIEAYKKQDNK